MEYLFIYLLQVVDVIKGCICFFVAISGVAGIAILPATLYYDDSKDDRPLKATIFIACVSLLLILVLSLIPTKQTLLLMGGTYLGKKAINVVATDEKIKKVDTIINLQLDKYIRELKNGTNNVE